MKQKSIPEIAEIQVYSKICTYYEWEIWAFFLVQNYIFENKISMNKLDFFFLNLQLML